MTGIAEAAARDRFAFADIGYLLHGTTIATNAVLERKLAKGALVTTARIRGRAGDRPSLSPRDLLAQSAGAAGPDPARSPCRHRRAHPRRRQRRDGADGGGIGGARREARPAGGGDGRDVLAQRLCQSRARDAHRRLSRADAAGPEGVALERPERRDPRVRAHFDDGSQRAADSGRRRLSRQARRAHARPRNCLPRLLLVQSNGGVCSAATAAREPVRLLLSGPSGGSAACALLGRRWARRTSSASTWAAPASTSPWCARGASISSPRARSTRCRCACRWWRSARSAPAADRSPRCARADG